jgi:hypothetical protein
VHKAPFARRIASEQPLPAERPHPSEAAVLRLQRSAGNGAVSRMLSAGSRAVIARQPAGVSERVVGRNEVAERSRTIAKIEIVGHASPRWRSAATPAIADANNWQLAEERAEMTRIEVETLLANLMPNRQLVFEYTFKRSSEAPSDEPVKALNEPADIAIGVEGRGSTETLGEAGKRGRTANDDPMRRVDVTVVLHSETETDVEEDVERKEEKSSATTDWSMWVTGQAGVQVVGGASGIMVQLKNEKTGVTGTYAGWTGSIGASVGVQIAQTSIPDFSSFTTPEPMTFDDFSGSNFTITSAGLNLGIGYTWGTFTFDHFSGGKPTPGDGVNIGGVSMGGIGLNLGNAAYGTMFLADSPAETYIDTTLSKRTQTFDSLGKESSGQRVLFDTGKSAVTPWQSDLLNEYLLGITVRSGL